MTGSISIHINKNQLLDKNLQGKYVKCVFFINKFNHDQYIYIA